MRSPCAGRSTVGEASHGIDCMVRNVSRKGACLMVASVVGIPSGFDLLIEGESASRPCNMVWHASNKIGVEFSGP